MNDIKDTIIDIKDISYIIEQHCLKSGGSDVLGIFVFVSSSHYLFFPYLEIYLPLPASKYAVKSRQSKVT